MPDFHAELAELTIVFPHHPADLREMSFDGVAHS